MARVLIIEDNADLADSTQVMLNLEAHEAVVARTGAEGVQRAIAWQPEVVLCDIGLPGMDGYEVAEHLRGNRRTAGAFLVAVTGYSRSQAESRARQAGFDVFLVKPADPAILLEVISSHGVPNGS